MIDEAGVRELLRKDRNEERLLQFAAWRTKSPQDAEDMLQTALSRVFGPEGPPWDPHGPNTFFRHVAAVLLNLGSNDRRSGRRRHEVVDESVAGDETRADGTPLPDQALDERRAQEEFRRLKDELLADLDAGDPEAAALLRAILEGQHDRGELAAQLGCSVDAIHAAHGRVRYRAGRLIEQDQKRKIAKLHARRAETGSVSAAASKAERSAS